MSRNLSEKALWAIADRLKNLGGWATLSAPLQPGETRSTLLRHIGRLVTQGKIKIAGRAKNTEYILVELMPTSSVRLALEKIPMEISDSNQNVVPFSDTSAELRKLIRLPLIARSPVGYMREFLESYIPNKASYLSKNDFTRLQAIGTAISPNELAPAGSYAKQALSRLLIELSWNSSRLEGNTRGERL